MQGDNIVSLLHGITFIYPTQTASSKFTLHHSKNNFVKHHACALYTARLFIRQIYGKDTKKITTISHNK